MRDIDLGKNPYIMRDGLKEIIFLYKKEVYKKHEVEIRQKLRNIQET